MYNLIKNNEEVVLHYVKFTNPLSFQTTFPKSGPTYMYRRQVVNPRHLIKHRKDNQLQNLELPCRLS